MTTLLQVKKHLVTNNTEFALDAVKELEGDEINIGNIVKSYMLNNKGEFNDSLLIANELLYQENQHYDVKLGAVVSKIYTYWRQGKYYKIPDLIEQADLYLQLIEDKNSDFMRWFTGKYYNDIGNYYWDSGDLVKAENNYTKSMDIAKEMNNKFEITRLLNNIGNVHYRNGNYELALNNYEMNLELKREISPQIDVSAALSNIGAIYLDTGQLRNALSYFQESIDSLDRSSNNDLSALAFRFTNIGYIHTLTGDLVKALEYFEKAKSIYINLQNRFLLGRTFGYIGQMWHYQNNQEKAEKYLETSLKILHKYENDFEISKVLYNLILVKIEQNLISEAEGVLATFEEIPIRNNNDIIKMRYQLAQAMICKNQPRLTSKVNANDIFIEVIQNPLTNEVIKNEARIGLCEILLMEYEVINKKDIKNDITSLINQIYKFGQQENAFPYIIRSLEFKSRMFLQLGDFSKALDILEIAEFYAEERGLNLENMKLQKVKQKYRQILLNITNSNLDNISTNSDHDALEYLEDLKKFNFHNSKNY